MSNKLTKEKLDSLIEQVLNEKLNINVKNFNKDDFDLEIFGSKRSRKDVKGLDLDSYKALSKAGGDEDTLTDKDYEVAGVEDPVVKQVMRHGLRPHRRAAIDPIKEPTQVGDIEDIDIDKQTYEPESIAFGQMANIGMQASNPSDPKPIGKMAEGLAASISTFFDGTKTFEDRVMKISNFSKTVFDEEKIKNLKVTEVLAASLFLDFLTTIVREIDSGAGAYQFEALLAAMAGGAVTGKAEGDSGTGQMGAVDFIMNDGSLGSSKYYTTVDSGKITQAYSGFAGKAGKTTLYIVAQKKGDASTTVASGQSDPTKIVQLNIYLVSVMPLIQRPKKASDFKVWVNGAKSAKPGTASGGKLNISRHISGKTPIVIEVASGAPKTLKQSLKASTERSEKKIKDAYKYFQGVFSEMYKANQKAQRYASTGDKDQGNEALTSLKTADDKFIQLAAEISDAKVEDITQDRKIKESKTKSLKDLDKLIERVILESTNK
jgi:hypothetical protein